MEKLYYYDGKVIYLKGEPIRNKIIINGRQEVGYTADGIDKRGVNYKITWALRPAYAEALRWYKIYQHYKDLKNIPNYPIEEEFDIEDMMAYDEVYAEEYLQQTDEACDWFNPISIEEQ